MEDLELEMTQEGEIKNTKWNYKQIAKYLKNNNNSVLIGWTDEEFTHYDILFTLGAYKQDDNYVQGGIRKTDLFVTIMRKGAFGFEVNKNKLYPGYISEKLFVQGESTLSKLTELINNIKFELCNTEK